MKTFKKMLLLGAVNLSMLSYMHLSAMQNQKGNFSDEDVEVSSSEISQTEGRRRSGRMISPRRWFGEEGNVTGRQQNSGTKKRTRVQRDAEDLEDYNYHRDFTMRAGEPHVEFFCRDNENKTVMRPLHLTNWRCVGAAQAPSKPTNEFKYFAREAESELKKRYSGADNENFYFEEPEIEATQKLEYATFKYKGQKVGLRICKEKNKTSWYYFDDRLEIDARGRISGSKLGEEQSELCKKANKALNTYYAERLKDQNEEIRESLPSFNESSIVGSSGSLPDPSNSNSSTISSEPSQDGNGEAFDGMSEEENLSKSELPTQQSVNNQIADNHSDFNPEGPISNAGERACFDAPIPNCEASKNQYQQPEDRLEEASALRHFVEESNVFVEKGTIHQPEASLLVTVEDTYSDQSQNDVRCDDQVFSQTEDNVILQSKTSAHQMQVLENDASQSDNQNVAIPIEENEVEPEEEPAERPSKFRRIMNSAGEYTRQAMDTASRHPRIVLTGVALAAGITAYLMCPAFAEALHAGASSVSQFFASFNQPVSTADYSDIIEQLTQQIAHLDGTVSDLATSTANSQLVTETYSNTVGQLTQQIAHLNEAVYDLAASNANTNIIQNQAIQSLQEQFANITGTHVAQSQVANNLFEQIANVTGVNLVQSQVINTLQEQIANFTAVDVAQNQIIATLQQQAGHFGATADALGQENALLNGAVQTLQQQFANLTVPTTQNITNTTRAIVDHLMWNNNRILCFQTWLANTISFGLANLRNCL